MNNLIWLFPIIFMIHDFEEIILIKMWKDKYNDYYAEKKIKRVPFGDISSTALFTVAVAEEFILFSAVTFIASISGNYIIWFSFYSAFIIHFVIHIIISAAHRIFVPGIVTSLLLICPSFFILIEAIKELDYTPLKFLILTITGLIILIINLKLLHFFTPKLEKLLY